MIEVDNLPKTIFITVSEAGKSFTQPIVFLPKQKDKEYNDKQEEFLKKLKERRLTKEDEKEWKEEFDKYAKSFEKRRQETNVSG